MYLSRNQQQKLLCASTCFYKYNADDRAPRSRGLLQEAFQEYQREIQKYSVSTGQCFYFVSAGRSQKGSKILFYINITLCIYTPFLHRAKPMREKQWDSMINKNDKNSAKDMQQEQIHFLKPCSQAEGHSVTDLAYKNRLNIRDYHNSCSAV